MLQLSPVGFGDEVLKGKDGDEVAVAEMIVESAADEEVAQLPAVSAQDEVCAVVLTGRGQDGVGERDGLEGDLLLGGAGDLLPLQGDEECSVGGLFGKHVDDVPAPAEALTDGHLGLDAVASAPEGGQDHLFEDSASSGVAWCHRSMFRRASTSFAGVLSPLQLIMRGPLRANR